MPAASSAASCSASPSTTRVYSRWRPATIATLAQQADLELKQQTATTSNASLQTLQRRLGALQQQISDNPLHLQPASAINKRLGELTDLAAQLGLRMEDVQPGKISTTARFETVSIHLAGTGNYRTCVQFLHRLRTGFPDTSVTSLQLTGNPSDPAAAASSNSISSGSPHSPNPNRRSRSSPRSANSVCHGLLASRVFDASSKHGLRASRGTQLLWRVGLRADRESKTGSDGASPSSKRYTECAFRVAHPYAPVGKNPSNFFFLGFAPL